MKLRFGYHNIIDYMENKPAVMKKKNVYRTPENILALDISWKQTDDKYILL